MEKAVGAVSQDSDYRPPPTMPSGQSRRPFGSADPETRTAGAACKPGLEGQAEGDTLIVKKGAEAVLTVTFDEQGWLTKLYATIQTGKP